MAIRALEKRDRAAEFQTTRESLVQANKARTEELRLKHNHNKKE